jgi:hypothetical protein
LFVAVGFKPHGDCVVSRPRSGVQVYVAGTYPVGGVIKLVHKS